MSQFNILIVDNNEQYRQSIRRRLEAEGYQIFEAERAEEAHTTLLTEIIHLAIIDIRLNNDDDLNDTSGLDLCREIDSLIGKLVITGYTDDWSVVRTALDPAKRGGKRSGADGFYSKEWDRPALLVDEVHRILQEKFEICPKARIAVLTSGGEAPGMNAAIWGIVRTAINNDIEVLGVQEGYRGLIDDNMLKLNWNRVSGIMAEGGTILQSARYDKFTQKEVRQQAVANIRKKQVTGLIVIGGDGSMRGAMALANDLAEEGINLTTVAIPGTIDNDLFGTDMSLGASSAANSMVDLIRNMIAPARALRRLFIVEVMGRFSGYLALEAAIGTGADAVVVAETIVDVHSSQSDRGSNWMSAVDLSATQANLEIEANKIADQMQTAFALGKHYGFVILAEGIDLATHEIVEKLNANGQTTEFLNGSYLKKLIDDRLDKWTKQLRPDVRVQNLGYPVRGVRPCRFDVWLGATLGRAAVNCVIEGQQTNVMVGWSEELGTVFTKYEEVIRKSNQPPRNIWEDRPKWKEHWTIQKQLASATIVTA